MGDKEEAEWLLEKLFERLEESLRKALKEEDNGAKKGNERYDPSEKQHDRCEEDDSGSEETITRCKESSRSQEEQEKTNPAPFDITR